MAQQLIELGVVADDGTGDTLRDGGEKINDNFSELYAAVAGSGYTDAQARVATQEWAPNFTAAGDLYIPAVEAMTISQGNVAIGTGTLTYTKSTAAAPSTFGAATLPVTLEAGAWLKIAATAVTGFVATHLKRTA